MVCRTNGSFAGAPRAEGFEAWELADPIRRGERFTVRFTLPKGLNRHREAQFHHCAEFMLPNTPEWIDGLIRNAREYDASPQRLIDDLTMAIADHDVEQVRHLVRSGARLPGTSRFGYNELHFAILRDGIDLAKYLIESGADVNEPTTSGQTPLMLATERGQEDLVRLLREKAAG